MSLPPPGPPSEEHRPPGTPGPSGGWNPPPGGGFGPPAGGGFGPPGYQPGAGPPIAPPGGGFQPPINTPIPVTPSDQKPPSKKGKVVIAAVIVAVLAAGGIAFAATRGGDDDADDRDDRDEITLPDDDEITLPASLPDFSLPDFTLPDDITIPDEITLPDDITIPDEITLPDDITIPDEITLPDDVTIPDDVTLPSFPSDVTIPDGPPTALGTPADLGSGFTVQVNSFNPDDTEALTATAGIPEPADGNVYATVNLTITFDGDPGLGYVVALDFTAVRPPDVSANWYSTIFVTPSDGLELTTELQPGDSTTGTIVFEVPASSTGDLTLVASSLLSFDGSAVAFALH